MSRGRFSFPLGLCFEIGGRGAQANRPQLEFVHFLEKDTGSQQVGQTIAFRGLSFSAKSRWPTGTGWVTDDERRSSVPPCVLRLVQGQLQWFMRLLVLSLLAVD